jgi:hypothetical protein
MADDPEFTKLFLELSLSNYQVNQFFYYYINPSLYKNLTKAMVSSDAVTWYVSESLRLNNNQVLNQQSTLVHIMMLLGSPDNNNNGLEKSLERFLYATVSNPYATENFVNTINFIDKDVKSMLLNFIFLGLGQQQHKNQASLNIYAMIKAMNNYIVANYNFDEQLGLKLKIGPTGLWQNYSDYLCLKIDRPNWPVTFFKLYSMLPLFTKCQKHKNSWS